MRNKFIISLFAFIVTLCACSKDDMPFEGKDNFISLFELEKDGTSYKALITDDKISVEIAENINLTNATVEYSISELSTITPDPKTITDWEKPIEFTVSSYNKTDKSYYFSVIKKEVVNNGDIELLSQADVDAFAFTGATKIDGNLIIGDVENLDALNKITEVSKNIIIKDVYTLDNFDALSKLKKTGNIYFGTLKTPFTPEQELNISFNSLTDIGEIIVNTAKIKTVALPKLKNAYNIYINSNSVDNIELSSLNSVLGNICIQSENNTSVTSANEVLTSLNLNALKTVLGSVSFNKLNSTEQIDLSQLKTVGCSLLVNNLIAVNNIKLDELTNVDNELKFNKLNVLVNLNIPKLTQVGSLNIEGGWGAEVLEEINMPELTTVNKIISITRAVPLTLSFPKLVTVGEQLKLNSIESVTSIDISKLTSCKNVYFSGISQITSLDLSNIANLETIELVSAYILEDLVLPQTIKDLTLNGGSLATNFPELKGIETISANLKLTNYKLPEITVGSVKEIGIFTSGSLNEVKTLEFSSLENIGELSLSLYNLVSFKAPKLKKVDKLDLSFLWKLNIIELPLLTEVTNELKISGGNYSSHASKCIVSDLNAFKSLTTVGSVYISFCGILTDFSGLKNAIPSLTEENWKVEECKYNPTYQNMLDGEYVEK